MCKPLIDKSNFHEICLIQVLIFSFIQITCILLQHLTLLLLKLLKLCSSLQNQNLKITFTDSLLALAKEGTWRTSCSHFWAQGWNSLLNQSPKLNWTDCATECRASNSISSERDRRKKCLLFTWFCWKNNAPATPFSTTNEKQYALIWYGVRRMKVLDFVWFCLCDLSKARGIGMETLERG